MIDSEVFLELKLKYGPLYSVSVKGIDLLFRELTFSEFDKIDKLQDSGDFSSADAEDYILECTIVYPENFNVNKIPAGAVSSLSQEILDASGFSSARTAKRILEQKRIKASEVRSLMKAFVLATIHTYSPEDLDDMTFSQLSERVALAEKIIEVQQSVYGIELTNVKLDLIDPEEEALKEQIIAAQHDAKRKEGEARYNDPIAQKLLGGI
jgi:hypothetical protein